MNPHRLPVRVALAAAILAATASSATASPLTADAAPVPAAGEGARTVLPPGADVVASRLETVLSELHRNGLLNGAALVADGGKVLLAKGYGFANVEWKVPASPDTKFRIGSVTKQFTAALALRLVEKGKLKLDGTVTEYLPWYRKDTGSRITVHHLLTHTSGIPNYTASPTFRDVKRLPAAVKEFVVSRCSGDLQFQPGSRFAYSNSGYFVLGAVLEAAGGKPYEVLLREEVLAPAGLADTGYDLSEIVLPGRAAGYKKTPGGLRNADFIDMALPFAAGALYSTANDLFRWDRALDGDSVLSAASREKMFTPFLSGYGYGWGVRALPPDGPFPGVLVHTHEGGIDGFSSLILRVPSRKAAVVLLDNTGDTDLAGISRCLLAILASTPCVPPRRSIADEIGPAVVGKGPAAAAELYRELKRTKPEGYDFSEGRLNGLGYQLLGMGRPEQAVAVFRLNAEAFPDSWNPWDSLGEALVEIGRTDEAIAAYERSVVLNKDNDNGVKALEKLRAAKPAPR